MAGDSVLSKESRAAFLKTPTRRQRYGVSKSSELSNQLARPAPYLIDDTLDPRSVKEAADHGVTIGIGRQQESDMHHVRSASRDSDPELDGVETLLADIKNSLSPYRYLTIDKLRADLERADFLMDDVSRTLITQICDCSDEVWDQPTNVHEWRSRLRYAVVEQSTGLLKLANEWLHLLQLRPDYLELAPPQVREDFAVHRKKITTSQKTRARLGDVQNTDKDSMARVSLTHWIHQRNEADRRLWDSSIADRNVRCGWAVEKDVSLKGITELGSQIASLNPTAVATTPEGTSVVLMKSRKRNRQAMQDDVHPTPLPPQKRTKLPGGDNGSNSVVFSSNPLTQIAIQASTTVPPPTVPQMVSTVPGHVAQAFLHTRTAAHASAPPQPQPMRNGRRIGLRPDKGSGGWMYEWSTGRKRAFLEITHVGQPLPAIATVDFDNAFLTNCTSNHVDLRLLGSLHITVVEIMTFFPDHLKWRAIAQRLRAAGWLATDVRMFIFWCRQLPQSALKSHMRPTMQAQSGTAFRWAEKDNSRRSAGWSMDSVSVDRGVVPTEQFHELSDYFLVDVAEGVVHFPQGADRGLLSVAVEHARHNNHTQVKTSELDQYIQQEQLVQLYGVSAVQTGTVLSADMAARHRHFPSSADPSFPGAIKTFWRLGGYYHE